MRKSLQLSVFFILSLLLGVAASCINSGIDGLPEDITPDTESTGSQTEDTASDTKNNDSESLNSDSNVDSNTTDSEPQATGSNPDSDPDTGEEPTDDEPQDDTGPAAEPTILGASHTGWKLPGCWSQNCHSKQTTHNSKLKPHNCAKCHGKNGATQRQPPHSPCIGCHSPIKNHVPATDFSNLATCSACHG